MMPGTTPYIAVRDLTLCRGKRVLFRGLTFDLVAGDRLAIMGDSGSGKSSLLQALLGRTSFSTQVRQTQRMPHVSHGTILVGGLSPERMNAWPKWLAANAGVLFQSGALFEGKSVQENLSFPFRHISRLNGRHSRTPSAGRLGELLKDVGLIPSETSDEERDAFLRTDVKDLSGGQRKRLALARALALSPRILLLDEPTSGLDSRTAALVADTIRGLSERDGVAVLCITHDPAFVERLGCNKRIRIGQAADVESSRTAHSLPGSPEAGREHQELDLEPCGLTGRLPAWADGMLGALRQTGLRVGDVLSSGASLCIPVGIIAGAGLTIQAVSAPRLVQTFLAQGVVAGVFLGMGTIMPALLIIGLCASGLTGELAQRKHGDQLEYLRLLGIRPWRFLGIPITAALAVATPLLIWVSEWMMLAGGAVALRLFETRSAVSGARFWHEVWRLIEWDMWQRSAIKGLTHGLLTGLMVCAFGFGCRSGEDGLRRAIARCVLVATLLVVAGDIAWSWYWAR